MVVLVSKQASACILEFLQHFLRNNFLRTKTFYWENLDSKQDIVDKHFGLEKDFFSNICHSKQKQWTYSCLIIYKFPLQPQAFEIIRMQCFSTKDYSNVRHSLHFFSRALIIAERLPKLFAYLQCCQSSKKKKFTANFCLFSKTFWKKFVLKPKV